MMWWESNYKSMSVEHLKAELARLAKVPHFVPDLMERKAFIATELALRT